ncbi:MAG: phosphotransferase family protein [Candidatus Binatia bacterium]|nr:phosphotransferase family protein [Candidatus Binatia bacterium]
MSEKNFPGKSVGEPDRHRASLEGWMQRNKPDVTDLRIPEMEMPASTGFSNETVVFEATWKEGGAAVSQRFVARIEQADGGLFPDQTAECGTSVDVQQRIMKAVAACDVVPVPNVIAYDGDPAVLGRPFFVMDFIEGEIPGDIPAYTESGFLVDEATPAQREQLVWDGVETLLALQKMDWREAGLDWLDTSGTGAPTLASQLGIYQSYVERELAGREHRVLRACLEWLESNAPSLDSVPVGVSWGDSRLANMIWRDYRCVAVLDWEAVSLLPAEADLGWWVMFDRMAFDDKGIARLEGYPAREAMHAHWEKATGRAVVGGIDYWEIFGAMRFDAIMIRLGDRLVDRGYVPKEANMAIESGTTAALERLLERQGVSF